MFFYIKRFVALMFVQLAIIVCISILILPMIMFIISFAIEHFCTEPTMNWLLQLKDSVRAWKHPIDSALDRLAGQDGDRYSKSDDNYYS